MTTASIHFLRSHASSEQEFFPAAPWHAVRTDAKSPAQNPPSYSLNTSHLISGLDIDVYLRKPETAMPPNGERMLWRVSRRPSMTASRRLQLDAERSGDRPRHMPASAVKPKSLNSCCRLRATTHWRVTKAPSRPDRCRVSAAPAGRPKRSLRPRACSDRR